MSKDNLDELRHAITQDMADNAPAWAGSDIAIAKYLPHLDTIDASDADKIELLETLCAILRTCVEPHLSGDTYVEQIDALKKPSQDSCGPVSPDNPQE